MITFEQMRTLILRKAVTIQQVLDWGEGTTLIVASLITGDKVLTKREEIFNEVKDDTLIVGLVDHGDCTAHTPFWFQSPTDKAVNLHENYTIAIIGRK